MDCSDPPPSELLLGIRQFNAGEFYECHETLEKIWIAEAGSIRRLYQGILQVGVAFYHLGRGNYRGCTSLLETGLAYLRPFAPACMTVDVRKLIEDAAGCYALLMRLGREHMNEFDWALVPHIDLDGRPTAGTE